MTDFQAAMLRSQLRRLQQIAERRREIARRYLAALPLWVTTQDGLADAGRMVYRFTLTFPDHPAREAMRAHLNSHGIQTIVPIERYELLHRYMRLDPQLFPNAERLVDTTLSLPLYPALSDDQVTFICQTLAEARKP
jgi:dTDP-4-amino-4,6-dideoxygalactose transaminase